MFLPALIYKVVKNYLSDHYNSKISPIKQYGRYLKLSYLRVFSRHAQNKFNRIIEKLCEDDVNINLVFVPYKIGSIFSTNDKMGETARHFPTRIKEHLKRDEKSQQLP